MFQAKEDHLSVLPRATGQLLSLYMSLQKNLKITKDAEKHSFNPASYTRNF